MNVNFFKPTEEEFNKAKSGGKLTFQDNETVGFSITEIKEQVSNDGTPLLIIGTTVTSGTNKGGEYAFFIRDNAISKGVLYNIMGCFWSQEQILAGNAGGIAMIGKSMSSICKVSAKVVNGETKTYQNFYEFTALDSTPQIGGTTAPTVSVPSTDSNIPF